MKPATIIIKYILINEHNVQKSSHTENMPVPSSEPR